MSKAYWTCFTPFGYHPKNAHCTHKYLGNIETPELMCEVIGTIQTYFNNHPFRNFNALFDVEDWFGPNKDIHVVRPKVIDRDLFRYDLYKELGQFREDDYDFNPHITCQEDCSRWDASFPAYYLCQGEDIKVVWN